MENELKSAYKQMQQDCFTAHTVIKENIVFKFRIYEFLGMESRQNSKNLQIVCTTGTYHFFCGIASLLFLVMTN
jgi:hypothetical protein